MADLLTDEVWRSLDPHRGRLPRRQTRQLLLAAALAGLLAVAGLAIWRSGLVMPGLDQTADNTSWSAGGGRFVLHLPVRNEGWTTLTVTGVGRGGPGLQLTDVVGVPATVAPHRMTTVYLFYRVTDCAAVQRGAWPVPVRIQRPWGTLTLAVQPALITVDVPQGLSSFVDGRDPYGQQWQSALARFSCPRT
jgi:hypothetical protein